MRWVGWITASHEFLIYWYLYVFIYSCTSTSLFVEVKRCVFICINQKCIHIFFKKEKEKTDKQIDINSYQRRSSKGWDLGHDTEKFFFSIYRQIDTGSSSCSYSREVQFRFVTSFVYRAGVFNTPTIFLNFF